MTLIRLPYDSHHYVVNSAELVSGSVVSGSMITEGAACYVYNLKKWKVINSDMSLTDLVVNVSGVGASGSYRASTGEKVVVVNGIITSIV